MCADRRIVASSFVETPLDAGQESAAELNTEHADRRRAEADLELHASYESYDQFVRASTRAAIMLFVVQVIASLVIANLSGADLRLAKWRFVPYLAIVANEPTFIKTVTWSTVAAVALTCVMALWVLHTRRGDQPIVYGWGTGIVMSGFLVLFQFLRGWLQPPAANSWILAQAGAMVAASALLFVGLRPDSEDSVPNETGENDGSNADVPDDSIRVTVNRRNK